MKNKQENKIVVGGYKKTDGTTVKPYQRESPKTQTVNGYVKEDGTKVDQYKRKKQITSK